MERNLIHTCVRSLICALSLMASSLGLFNFDSSWYCWNKRRATNNASYTQNIDKPTCIQMRLPHSLTFVSLSIVVCRSASSFSCLIWSIAMDSSNFFCSCMHETQEECFAYMHRPNKEAFTSSHREAFVHRVRLAFLLKTALWATRIKVNHWARSWTRNPSFPLSKTEQDAYKHICMHESWLSLNKMNTITISH